MSDLSESLTVAHLSWATWTIRSALLICLERPERFAHSSSFVLSDLSDLLTVAHLIWVKWANLPIPSPAPENAELLNFFPYNKAAVDTELLTYLKALAGCLCVRPNSFAPFDSIDWVCTVLYTNVLSLHGTVQREYYFNLTILIKCINFYVGSGTGNACTVHKTASMFVLTLRVR